MKRFAALFSQLDGTTKTNAKVAALADYFREAPEKDRLWTIALLSGRRPKRAVTATRLAEWAAEQADLPFWLFQESYAAVGDLAETISLILPPSLGKQDHPLSYWLHAVKNLQSLSEEEKKPCILDAWLSLVGTERFLFNKLLTGGFRVGVSQKLMTRALAQATEIEEADLAHRLMGDWTPEHTTWEALILTNDPAAQLSRPYPFYLAYQIEDHPDTLGSPSDWFADWKWDGIRGQLIRRGGEHFLWSRGEELITERFPEFQTTRDWLPDGTVIDGEILAFSDGHPLPFSTLQKRIGRKTVSKKVLKDAPAILMAYDLLETEGEDIRQAPFEDRRKFLSTLLKDAPCDLPIRLSPEAAFKNWADLADLRETARERGTEGLMLKRRMAPYLSGRKKGDWWKWKVDPLTIDAVMIYAQAGHGRRATLYTDFTFAVWDEDTLVPFTKAYSGLTYAEFQRITNWVKRNTLERFGPVRRVKPEHVFEIAFEGIQESSRHKSGIALRFPRMLRWREDKPPEEANTLSDLKALLKANPLE